MAISRVFFSDLKTGGCSSVVETRLLRFWEVRSPRRGGELMRVDMILMDVNSTMIQASINAPRLPKFWERLAAGTMFTLTGFDVVPCKQTRVLTDSSLSIRFNGTTEFDVIDGPIPQMPIEAFRFINETELFSLANTNSQLPDIVAELTAVKSTVTDPPQGKNHVMVTIKLNSSTHGILSLFDNQAIDFHRRLESMQVDPRVIVATNINPRVIGARLFLNATTATHVYLDKETGAGQTYFDGLITRDSCLTPAAPLLKTIAKVEPVTIAELNSFVIPAVSEDIEFMCTARVVQLFSDKGWCFLACSKCGRKLMRIGSSFRCVRCSNPNADGALRYRVELSVADDSAEGIFICFDGVMTKLHGMKASEAGHMLAGGGENPEYSQMPPFVTNMVGKTYSFHVKLTRYDFAHALQSFTVSRILEEHTAFPLPEFFMNDEDGDESDNIKSIQPDVAGVDCGTSIAETVKETDGSVMIETDSIASHVHKKARTSLAEK